MRKALQQSTPGPLPPSYKRAMRKGRTMREGRTTLSTQARQIGCQRGAQCACRPEERLRRPAPEMETRKLKGRQAFKGR